LLQGKLPEQIASWQLIRNICQESSYEKKHRERSLVRDEVFMTVAELSTVAHKTMIYMQRCPDDVDEAQAYEFSRYLFTCTLARVAPPRTQVLRHLRINQTLVRESSNGLWRMRYDGTEHSKTMMLLLLVLPSDLSRMYEKYLQHVRPRLVQSALAAGTTDHQYVYPNIRSLEERDEFTTWTKQVTMQLIGREVPPHHFRQSVTQAIYQTGASPRQMQDLSELMQHSTAIQSRYYRAPQFERLSIAMSEQLQSMYAHESSRDSSTSAASCRRDTEMDGSSSGDVSTPPRQGNRPQNLFPRSSKWSAAEEEALLEAVRKHGKGRWKAILKDSSCHELLQDKTVSQLRNKYAHMQEVRSARQHSAQTRDAVADDEEPAAPAITLT
jgi:hypothetical protein